ncbi:MAG: FKBP-type peptidyl-prolyl cis-trans isomerase [Candidatus Yanofskybacteria bacterium GW2011_GWA2_44_9]|uniref:Peptidyl-prolyl cis-trans isomerase n=2 Tax=Candidatus Yanofskyibacteriota TaxID=1752733 RepID=A0A0G1MPK0_9BACT|nr:MAG: FKBP-type peptidyl-prolyl cis-trans isomerase [Candidatus Yanofskybacteria bacterium GW2011_GWA2_44_9]
MYLILVVFVGLSIWFFMQKSNNVKNGDITQIASETASPTAMPTATEFPWVELEGGLKYRDVVVGSGEKAVSGYAIAANYEGTLEDGTKFDSSYDRGQPFAFILGGGMVIKGWDVGIVGMKVGGKRKLIIPPAMAYGNKVRGPIPANSTLYFDVELVAVQGPQPKE